MTNVISIKNAKYSYSKKFDNDMILGTCKAVDYVLFLLLSIFPFK